MAPTLRVAYLHCVMELCKGSVCVREREIVVLPPLFRYNVVLELSLTTTFSLLFYLSFSLPFSLTFPLPFSLPFPLPPSLSPSYSPSLSPSSTSSPPPSQGERAQLLPTFHSSVVQCLERATAPSPQSAFFEEALVACHLLMSTSEEGTSSQSLIAHILI